MITKAECEEYIEANLDKILGDDFYFDKVFVDEAGEVKVSLVISNTLGIPERFQGNEIFDSALVEHIAGILERFAEDAIEKGIFEDVEQ
jgi:hypothetical protein